VASLALKNPGARHWDVVSRLPRVPFGPNVSKQKQRRKAAPCYQDKCLTAEGRPCLKTRWVSVARARDAVLFPTVQTEVQCV